MHRRTAGSITFIAVLGIRSAPQQLSKNVCRTFYAPLRPAEADWALAGKSPASLPPTTTTLSMPSCESHITMLASLACGTAGSSGSRLDFGPSVLLLASSVQRDGVIRVNP